jgi:hypothetical protein
MSDTYDSTFIPPLGVPRSGRIDRELLFWFLSASAAGATYMCCNRSILAEAYKATKISEKAGIRGGGSAQ